MAPSKDPTIIKKYANRRLYHTGTSSYVTLEDLSHMVRAGEDFTVCDAKTGEDITRSVLAQIIFEEESKTGQNLLPIAFLRQLIRFYGDSIQALVPRYLEFSLDTLTREQHTFKDLMGKTFAQSAFPAAPFSQGGFEASQFANNPFSQTALQNLEEQTKRNMDMFSEALKLFNPFAAINASELKEAEPAPKRQTSPEQQNPSELEEIKRQVATMQATIDKLSR